MDLRGSAEIDDSVVIVATGSGALTMAVLKVNIFLQEGTSNLER